MEPTDEVLLIIAKDILEHSDMAYFTVAGIAGALYANAVSISYREKKPKGIQVI